MAWHAYVQYSYIPGGQLYIGLPGVIKTKTGLDKFYGNFFIKNIFI